MNRSLGWVSSAAALVVLTGATGAWAGALTQSGSTLGFAAGAGERNAFTATGATAGKLVIYDGVAGPVLPIDLTAAPPTCKLVTTSVECASTGIRRLQISLGNLNDRAKLLKTRVAATVRGGAGNDTLTTDAGADTIIGDSGNDAIDGNAGNDLIRAGSGNDRIIAVEFSILGRPTSREGNDNIDCGPGRDRATVDRSDRVRNCERVTRL